MSYTHEHWAQGGALDTAKPSPQLVAEIATARGADGRFATLTDEELLGVVGRVAVSESWVLSLKLGAVAELARRKQQGRQERRHGMPACWDDGLTEELMPVLGMGRRASGDLVDMAVNITGRLDVTAAALEAGEMGYIKARIVADATIGLADDAAVNAERLAQKWCGGSFASKTPAEIGKLIARAAVAADPRAAQSRRENAERDSRVESWNEAAGTVTLAALGVNPAEAAAAEQVIDDTARAYKKAGIGHRIGPLRVQALLDKVLGRDPLASASAAVAGLRAEVNLTLPVMILPLLTVLGLADNPGEAGRQGVLDPGLVRQLATAAAAAGATSRWHLTLTDDRGRAVAHGCQDGAPGMNPGKKGTPFTITSPQAGKLTFQLHPIPLGAECDHRFEVAGHDPSPLLRHLVQVRDGSCVEFGCSRAAVRCDFEHSIPFEKGGRTCLCNGNCKCRRGHGLKQRKDWAAIQTGGYTQWHTANGRTHITGPRQYPI